MSPNPGGEGRGVAGSQPCNGYSCAHAHGAQINFEDLTPKKLVEMYWIRTYNQIGKLFLL
jgi:hypothetical protein